MEKKKNPIFFALLGVVGIFAVLGTIAFLRGDKGVRLAVEKSQKIAIRSFQILGLDGKGKNPRDKVRKSEEGSSKAELKILTVGEETVYYPEYMFYLLASKKKFEVNFGREIWEEEKEEEKISKLMKEDVAKEIIQLKLMKKKAETEGILLTEAEKKELMSSAGEQFLQIEPILIAKHYFTTDLLAGVYEENFLASKYVRYYEKERNLVGKKKIAEELLTRVYQKLLEENEIVIFYENLEGIEF